MTDYVFKYRVQSAPEAQTNGSGMIAFDMYAVYSEVDSGDPFVVVPGYHKTALISAAALKVANDMPSSTTAEKVAKNTAIKNLLSAALGIDIYPTSTALWDTTSLESYMDANDSAALETARLNVYITEVLNQSFPIDLNL